MITMRIGAHGQIEHVREAKSTPASLRAKTERMLQNVQAHDAFEGRQVVAAFAAVHTDGTAAGVHKVVRSKGDTVPARQYASPVPYFRLNDARRAELEADAKALSAKIAAPGLDPVVRDKLRQDLRKIEDELGMDRNALPERSSSLPGRGYDRSGA